MNENFNISLVIDKLRESSKIFSKEADFQQEMALMIRKLYPSATVKLEYNPTYDDRAAIDILVIIDNKWYPIELKYKTKKLNIVVDNIAYHLKDHDANNESCYLYLKDIEKIEKFKDNEPLFEKGYTIFLTNDLLYLKEPRESSQYIEFSLYEGAIKSGTMNWKREAVKKGFEEPITLKGTYTLNWKEYSTLDSENGTFMYLVNEIDK